MPQAVRAAKFYSVTLCIHGSWKRNLARVTILGPTILQGLLDIGKTCGSLTLSISSLRSFTTTENPPVFSLLFCRSLGAVPQSHPRSYPSGQSAWLLHFTVMWDRVPQPRNTTGRKNVSYLRFTWRLRLGTWRQVAGKLIEILVEHASTLKWYVPTNRPEPVRL
jgi:hypothetical protein